MHVEKIIHGKGQNFSKTQSNKGQVLPMPNVNVYYKAGLNKFVMGI